MKFIVIDPSSWSAMTKLFLLLIPVFMVCIGMVIIWLIAGTRLFDVMCEAFKNSHGLDEDRELWGALTLKARALIVCGLSVGMVWPAFGVRQGWLNEGDHRTAPVYLKRGLKISFWANMGGAVLLAVAYQLVRN